MPFDASKCRRLELQHEMANATYLHVEMHAFNAQCPSMHLNASDVELQREMANA